MFSSAVTFRHPKHDVFIPDQTDPLEALRRVTHLGIVSHQDDLEIAAYHGITECFHSENEWFGGVVVTDGAGASTRYVLGTGERRLAPSARFPFSSRLQAPQGGVGTVTVDFSTETN